MIEPRKGTAPWFIHTPSCRSTQFSGQKLFEKRKRLRQTAGVRACLYGSFPTGICGTRALISDSQLRAARYGYPDWQQYNESHNGKQQPDARLPEPLSQDANECWQCRSTDAGECE